MWGHDLRRMGRIDEAIAAFRRTDELEKAYYAAEGILPELDWHHVHNLDLLATAYQHRGRLVLAEATMREAVALRAPIDRVEFDQKMLAAFLLGRRRWDEALAASGVLTRGRWGATRAVGQALLGHALLAAGRVAEARQALQAADRELEGVPSAAVGIGVSRGQVLPWVDTLRGELLLRDSARSEGRRVLEGVAASLRGMPGPDAWIQATFRLEAIARLAREMDEWELAEIVARQMLEHDPSYAGSHFALAQVAEHRGDAAGAARDYARAESHWSGADDDLAELRLARTRRSPPR
jgi:tetratricopeptide (TPR) repeat protein